jgi:formamidopyrimidine-DNA glycosylase
LSAEEKKALYTAIVGLVEERLRLGGKDQATDLFGKQGRYVPKMGQNMKDQNCPACNGKIEKINHGGGQVYICLTCQK